MASKIRGYSVLAAALFCLGIARVANAGTIYDTTPSWGSGWIGDFGAPNTTTFGETFLAPAFDATLQDFAFHLKVDGQLQLKAYIYEWSGPLEGWGGKAVGSAVFGTASSINLTGDGTSFQSVVVNTGGLNLTEGGQYVALFTVSDPTDFAASTGRAKFGLTPSNSPNDGGGGFVFLRNGDNYDAITSDYWNTMTDFGDLAWAARFGETAVSQAAINNPEPATATLIVIGLVGAAGYGWRRKRAIQNANFTNHATESIL